MGGVPEVTVAEMKEIERRAIEDMGLCAAVLMENAGRAVALEAEAMAAGGRVAVVCGPGANGGDGCVAARHLANSGIPVTVVALDPGRMKGEAAANLRALRHSRVALVEAAPGETEHVRAALQGASLAVDAVFGTGMHGPARPPWDRIIEAINASGVPVLSVDVPSGMGEGPDACAGPVVRAACTVTFHAPKAGFSGNAAFTGRVVVAGIGIPALEPPGAPR